jgi:virginiamycin B lyase
MRLLKLVFLAAALALVPSSAIAAPALDGTFTPTGQPGQLAPGPDGNVWFALTTSSANHEYGKIAPDGTITEFDTPTAGLNLVGVTSGPNSHVWFSYTGGVLEVDPATGVGTEHTTAPTLAGPRGITTGPDGNLWVVAIDRLVKFAPDGSLIDGNIQNGNVSGRDITTGSDGRLWVADFGNNAITAVSPTPPYTKQSFAVGAQPQGIVPGPTGQLGFSAPSNTVGHIAVDGTISPTPDTGSDATGVTYANDGAYWFAEFNTQTVGRLTTDGQLTHPFTLPAASGPRYIAKGANNTLWVSAETSKTIHRITGVEAPTPPTTTTTDPPGTTTPPPPDTVAPVLTAVKVNVKTRTLSLTLSEPATLGVVVERKTRNPRTHKNRWTSVRAAHAQGTAGANKISLGKKKLKPGTYRARVTATDAAGNAAKKTVSFKVSAPSRRRR